MDNKRYAKALFIFRRDLRLEDNTGLIAALASSGEVVPCFIFDPCQTGPGNSFRGDHAVQFMLESLADLSQQLEDQGARLYYFSGEVERVLDRVLDQYPAQAVFVNRDYTPFSRMRDLAVQRLCEQRGVDFQSRGDALLHEPGEVVKNDGTPYTIFTPFYRRALEVQVRPPSKNQAGNYFIGKIPGSLEMIPPEMITGSNPRLRYRGGRQQALTILRQAQRFRDYERQRDIPADEATTGLSGHNKFGTCSIREVYGAWRKTLGPDHPLLRQLYWRDFLTHIAWHFPGVFGHCFRAEYENLGWENDQAKFESWCAGKTGFPIVDAGMRELNTTGFMHNRVRMIAASFLVKDLHVDWRWGERYFAQKLLDYDPSVNNGNWQWAASTGCDAQPYFRIFNPWLQQVRFDPQARYIKRWIPELTAFSPVAIHRWDKQPQSGAYPAPIVDHAAASARAKAMFQTLKHTHQDFAGRKKKR